jgi:hypothetical protein
MAVSPNNRTRRNNRNGNRNGTRSGNRNNNNLSRFPLNVTNVLGPTTRTRFLCDSSVSNEIFNGHSTLVHIKPFTDERGKGSFGYTLSAEMKVNIFYDDDDTKEITCLSALKVSRRAADIRVEGIPADMLIESSVYSCTAYTKALAKAMFIKLSMTDTRIVMEHYVMNLKELVKGIGAKHIPMNEFLMRAIVFQVAYGLAELHARGILHKDLKLDNILVAHDGRLLITDYSLSVYHCVEPLKPRYIYFKRTTPTIQPPEVIETDWVGPAFDIWSLGATFAYLFTYPDYIFNFFEQENSSNLEDWMTVFKRAKSTNREYQKRIDKIFSIAQSKNFSEPSMNLLDRMLHLEPADRPSALEIINDEWFAGLTLDEAIRTVRLELGTIGVINKKTFNILNSTKTPRNIPPNTGIQNYFNIQPVDDRYVIPQNFIPKMRLVSHYDKYTVITWIFFTLFQEKAYSFYVFLHAIELYERLTQTYAEGIDNIPLLDGAMCFVIATKVSPYNYDKNRVVPIEYIRTKLGRYSTAQIIKSEIKIISALHGDLFPLVNGFVSDFLNIYMNGVRDSPQQLYRFMLGIFCYIFWDGKVGTIRDFFHTVDVAYVESGEVGQGIPGEEPNTKGPQSISRRIIQMIHTNVDAFSKINPGGGISPAEKLTHILNSLNPYIIQKIFTLTGSEFSRKDQLGPLLKESSQYTITPL